MRYLLVISSIQNCTNFGDVPESAVAAINALLRAHNLPPLKALPYFEEVDLEEEEQPVLSSLVSALKLASAAVHFRPSSPVKFVIAQAATPSATPLRSSISTSIR
ncbi:hypothetical protein J2W32_004459 [Variovorax boronicumulans]|uniref:Uncharacterized protein n=1 Tax=Variovorax boronicumulans TaxID=436515 RepID=A0AAW8D6E5_9BURK|nr:hypothetical protein [Variovorax boronicumulans]MDP9895361.1 hypothetical protein [Variovorax boronicumulans]MDQ0055401.1 hypothetical protein [Variovorax boronicumulans]